MMDKAKFAASINMTVEQLDAALAVLVKNMPKASQATAKPAAQWSRTYYRVQHGNFATIVDGDSVNTRGQLTKGDASSPEEAEKLAFGNYLQAWYYVADANAVGVSVATLDHDAVCDWYRRGRS
jgi:hypothetical protein